MNKNTGNGSNGNRKLLIYLILFTLLLTLIRLGGKTIKEDEMRISYDELITEVKDQQVESITAYESTLNIDIVMKNEEEKYQQYQD